MSEETVIPKEQLKDAIIAVIKTSFDPEIPVDIYELGLIYEIIVIQTLYKTTDYKIIQKLIRKSSKSTVTLR